MNTAELAQLADKYGFSMVIAILLIITTLVNGKIITRWLGKIVERIYSDFRADQEDSKEERKQFIRALNQITDNFKDAQRVSKSNHKDMQKEIMANHRETLAIIERIGEQSLIGLEQARDEHDELRNGQSVIQEGQKEMSTSMRKGLQDIKKILKKN